jgi:hypothetical protein
MGAVAAGVYMNRLADNNHYDETVAFMEEIETAILGSYAPRKYGMRISGYVADLGNLPALNKDGQPATLWHRDGLPKSTFHEDWKIATGWNGPYVSAPESGFLTDAWGNALQFKLGGGSLTMTSFGADGKKGGQNLAQDITRVIEKKDYMAALGGHVERRLFPALSLHYPQNGVVETVRIQPDAFGNFLSRELDVPIGLRSIVCNSAVGEAPRLIVFPVVPGANWLGSLR